jgi:hypothetical protein
MTATIFTLAGGDRQLLFWRHTFIFMSVLLKFIYNSKVNLFLFIYSMSLFPPYLAREFNILSNLRIYSSCRTHNASIQIYSHNCYPMVTFKHHWRLFLRAFNNSHQNNMIHRETENTKPRGQDTEQNSNFQVILSYDIIKMCQLLLAPIQWSKSYYSEDIEISLLVF